MALKLDLSKAYDRVDWIFLEKFMLKLGFCADWVQLLMQCVSLVSYTVISGGSEVGLIFPKMGVRQGDPLSPYIFLLCAEGLSFLIHKAEVLGQFHVIKIARNAPIVTHVFFADDLYIFSKASMEDAQTIQSILTQFQEATGQRVNFQKSSIFFSSNSPQFLKASVCNTLSMSEADGSSFYLGLPNLLGWNKNVAFSFIKDKMSHRILSWESRCLSKAGKELLLKSVAQAIPAYAMGVFLLPISLCKELERLMSIYWWKQSKNGRKGVHWKRWSVLTKHKSRGGLGFRDIHEYNIAFLSKQSWRFLSCSESLVGQLYKARYFLDGHFLSAKLGYYPSYLWHSLMATQEVLKIGARRRVGNGLDINIMGEPWLPCKDDPYVHSNHPGLKNRKVVDLFQMDILQWDTDIIHDMFTSRDSSLILSVPLLASKQLDQWFWAEEPKGVFSVKSLYRSLQFNKDPIVWSDQDSIWKRIWKLGVPPKVRVTLWRAAAGCLPTRANL